ncbi:Mitochondrial import inner membrane translocase subunit Tim8 A [Ooceraea biroi]|uniref:Mitochondrial import inner membrane translocase subunit n=1 Tax=Ooceraea biroi TaxID=2015173 RepID=A0A026WAM6_OOCBI|nr:Mitochondrial import inner membrane translocase subunit Tim8 A [Ooceraea biroi]
MCKKYFLYVFFIILISKLQYLFQGLVHELTGICWETCMDKPSPRLEPKVHKCLVNCVERFIDTTNYITNRIERVAANLISEADSLE